MIKALPKFLFFYRVRHVSGKFLGKNKKEEYILVSQKDALIYKSKPTEATYKNSKSFTSKFNLCDFTILVYTYEKKPTQVASFTKLN